MRITTFCLLLLSFITIGCGTDDDGAESFELTTENIVGVYDISALSVIETDTYLFNGETVTDSYNSVGSDFNTTWTFTESGTLTLTGSYTITDSGVEDGESYSETYLNTLNESGTYLVNETNETITLSFEEDGDIDVSTFSIESFSRDTITLVDERSETGADFSYESIITLALSRR